MADALREGDTASAASALAALRRQNRLLMPDRSFRTVRAHLQAYLPALPPRLAQAFACSGCCGLSALPYNEKMAMGRNWTSLDVACKLACKLACNLHFIRVCLLDVSAALLL